MKPGIFSRPQRNTSSLLIAHTCQDGPTLEVFFGLDQSTFLPRQKCQRSLSSTRRRWDGTSQKISARITTELNSAQSHPHQIESDTKKPQLTSWKKLSSLDENQLKMVEKSLFDNNTLIYLFRQITMFSLF